MRRNWLASAVLGAAAISMPVVAVSGTAHAATLSGQRQTAAAAKVNKLDHKAKAAPQTFNNVAAALARRLVGAPYVYGGTSPAGFDCSGLAQYVYAHTGHGKRIPRTADDQFLWFRRVGHTAARPGDLVFFHDTSSAGSYVYHVGVYEGGDIMVAATTYGEGVQLQSFSWAGDTVTFGTITH